jgi:hypothetical protein
MAAAISAAMHHPSAQISLQDGTFTAKAAMAASTGPGLTPTTMRFPRAFMARVQGMGWEIENQFANEELRPSPPMPAWGTDSALALGLGLVIGVSIRQTPHS